MVANPTKTIDGFNLTGKVAVVTGGAGILGSAIALGLGQAGAKICLTDIAKERVESTAADLRDKGISAIGLRMDAFDKDSIREALDRAESELGEVGILLNAAGGNRPDATVGPETPFFSLSADALRSVVDLNLFAGAIHPCQVIGERMASRKTPSSIINIASMTAIRPLTRVVGYSAAKAAVANFTQWLAVYMAKDVGSNVRVNAIAPGFFLTDQNRYLLTNPDGSATERGKTVIGHTPMGRYGNPEDLIGACIWLAGEMSSFVTGIVVPIDGGYSTFGGA
jgi:NAD(P)-dependent dehydrogenase (short-subunit alcohol dehydrogenase family)